MTCNWQNCTAQATTILFRPAEGVLKAPNNRRIWNENLPVCPTCLPTAQQTYPYTSFVRPDQYETHIDVGCFR